MNQNYTTNQSATNPEKAKFVASLASQNYKGPSIQDYLNLSGYDSSQASRTQLGTERGISGIGTAQGNTALLNALRTGSSPTPTNTGAGTNTGSPTQEQPTQSPADLAFAEYLKSLQPTEEEKQAKTFVDTLVANSKLAREKALNSGETMGFASGEAQRVQRNNDLSIDAANSTYSTVKSFRDREGVIGKAKYDYAKGKETEAKANAKTLSDENKPFELSPGQKRYTYNKATGKYELTASAPEKATTQKAPTQKANLKSDVNASIEDLRNVIQTKNWAGVSLDHYNTLIKDFQREHGSAGVAEFQKALANAGLKVDKNIDGEGVGE